MKSLVIAFGVCLLAFGVIAAPPAETTPTTPAKIDYNRDVRPVLADACFSCHGPDEKTRKAKLRLDTKEGMFSASTVVPGKPAASELMTRIQAHDGEELMPPAKSGKKLTAAQIALLKAWIEQGATWSSHWAFTAPVRQPIPDVAKQLARNPIDNFVLARLAKEGLTLSPEADKATLIRRLSLDLTGLPPTPEEVAAFLKDDSPEAYEKVVDRLLASPHYGERMAMTWLDGARYADSNGYQADFERFMWRWRDWVIDAFNTNMPYDQFTIEQLAGDMLPNATVSQKLATGFNRNHRINTEGGIIAEEWRIETVVDRVDTTGSVWLGLTLGCCRCHDHKYDPITQKEFYQLFSYFNNVPESGAGLEAQGNTPPTVRAPRPQDEAKLKELKTAIETATVKAKDAEKELLPKLAAWEKTVDLKKLGATWVSPKPTEATAAKAKLEVLPDYSIHATGPNGDSETYTVTVPTDVKELSAVRFEVFPDDKLAAKGPGRSQNGNFVLTDVRVAVDGKPVKLTSATASFNQEHYAVSAAIDADPVTGWAIHPKVGQPHDAVFAFEKSLKLDNPAKVAVTLVFGSQFAGHQPGRFRVSVTDAKSPHERGVLPAGVAGALAISAEKRTPQQAQELMTYFRQHHAGAATDADRELAAATKTLADFEKTFPTAMVMDEMPKPRDAFVLVRGQYDKKGDKVSASVPAALPALPKDAPNNRLGLAKWIASPDNPLTARVAVNRFWEQLFGAGLVRSTENFGIQGEPPTHPKLLDWLATEFVRLKWDMKATQKTIVMSATYRQSSKITPELLAKDPDNRLLARQTRFRLPAELVRDNALAASGLLTRAVGGPSVRPYMPAGVWDETNFYGNLRNYKHDVGDNLYRRSLYTIWKRTAAPPSMLLFDAPGREVCSVRRGRTNTPLQALALMNEVTFVEASRLLATKAIKEGGKSPEERITHAFRLAISRPPTDAELKVLAAGVAKRTEAFKANPDSAKKLLTLGDTKPDATIEPAELAAYTVTASVILNLDETITRE
ncbi:MAG: PSD1 and planctomycete cytochrome C domain-containing protein [Planctomycetes bacterium]|nr:PSD1 and planctomycete cytochrome C domain-containing protein [Planctomycetota bacterium]